LYSVHQKDFEFVQQKFFWNIFSKETILALFFIFVGFLGNPEL